MNNKASIYAKFVSKDIKVIYCFQITILSLIFFIFDCKILTANAYLKV